MSESNRGEIGIDSIRINNQRVSELPLGQGNSAKEQLPDAISAEKKQRIENILASYPRITREYAEARVREAQTAMQDFARVKNETQQTIRDFASMAKAQQGKPTFRSIESELSEIAEATDLTFDEKKAKVRELRSGCTEYDAADLYEQIGKYQENIERLDEAIQAENDSIAELRSLLGKIEVRDAELAKLGVTRIE